MWYMHIPGIGRVWKKQILELIFSGALFVKEKLSLFLFNMQINTNTFIPILLDSHELPW